MAEYNGIRNTAEIEYLLFYIHVQWVAVVHHYLVANRQQKSRRSSKIRRIRQRRRRRRKQCQFAKYVRASVGCLFIFQVISVNTIQVSSGESLTEFVNERLPAADGINMWSYNQNHGGERHLDDRHKLLDVNRKPLIKLHRIELPQQHVCKDEVVSDNQLSNQECNTGMDQDNTDLPQLKLEKEEPCSSQDGQQLVVKQKTVDSLTPAYEQSDHSELQTLSAAENESDVNMPVISSVVGAPNHLLLLSYKPLTVDSPDPKDDKYEDYRSAGESEPNLNKQQHERRSHTDEYKPTLLKTRIINHKEEIDPHYRMLDITLKPEIKLHRIEFPQKYACKVEEEVFTDQHLLNQERNSSMEQEEPEPLQIKEEQVELCTSQEVEQHVVKQETDTFMLTPAFEENDHSGDQTLYLNLGETLNGAQKESVVKMPIISFVIGAPNSDLMMPSNKFSVAESPIKKRYTCGKDLNFKAKSHVKTQNTGEKLYVCKTCGKMFRYNCYLTVHMRIHSGEKPYVCEICGKCFRSNCYLTGHMKIHSDEKPYVCEICGKGFRRNDGLTFHVRIHSDERPYVCKTCGKGYNFKHKLTLHMRIHTEQRPYVCKTCGKGYNSKHKLTLHTSIHSDELPYVCKICEKGFKSNGNLTGHMRIHSDEKPYVCKTCGKDFKSKSALTGHMRIHSDEKPYVCKTCGKDFKFKSALTCHMRIHSDEKPYVCKTCGKGFKSNGELTAHMRIHSDERPYVCKTCGKGFKSNGKLTVHMRIHSDEKPYVCKTCGKDFKSKIALTCHMRIHSDLKLYVCKTCGKRFKSNGELTAHMRIHSDERPYVCKRCGKGFKSNGKLTLHLRIHSDERPYVCKTCGKGFKSNGDLTAHMRIHSDERPYVCKKCGKSFRWRGDLKGHLRKTHSDEKVPLQGLLQIKAGPCLI